MSNEIDLEKLNSLVRVRRICNFVCCVGADIVNTTVYEILFEGRKKLAQKRDESIIPFARRMSAISPRKPEFLIIGAQKAGTSSLYRYLVQHPEILAGVRKEIHYFDLCFDKGPNWYTSQFPIRKSGRLSCEATPYYLFHPLVPERCRAFSPDFKLIALLRDPVARAYSHYHHEVEKQREGRAFSEAVWEDLGAVENAGQKLADGSLQQSPVHQRYSYLARGHYAHQMERWFQHFSREQVYLETSERFFREPGRVCRKIFDFLGLQPVNVHTDRVHNTGSYESMSERDRKLLAEHYEPHNAKLESEFELDLSEWRRV